MRFAWYDLWVGAYIDQAKRTLYICPLPMLLLVVRYGRNSVPAVASAEPPMRDLIGDPNFDPKGDDELSV
jgi:hypothetical protein